MNMKLLISINIHKDSHEQKLHINLNLMKKASTNT